MAILKHIASKSRNYNKALEYLMFQHNEFTQKPMRDDYGNMLLREEYYLDGLNCDPFTFSAECNLVNKAFCKNYSALENKSHHYIISFDPRDVEVGLNGAMAQKLGLEFAQKFFAGHQTLVCTHTDGHNKSGNIHVHIILNSVRKYDIEPADFTERPCDSCAGFKHHLTDKLLQHMKQSLMDICKREHFHQVDLFSPAAEKVTDREYRLNQRRQNAQEYDAPKSSKMSPGSTRPFQSQKKFLQDAIREVSSYAQSLEEFGADLKKYYRIQFKVSRGRFSYLHPDRNKYMTGRTLGDDYTEKYLMPLFDGNRKMGRTREQMLKESRAINPQHTTHANEATDDRPAYDPSYDYSTDPTAALQFHTKFRLVVDLQNCARAKASHAYARKVKMSNLQQMAQTICFVQENGIDTQAELNGLLAEKGILLRGLDPRDPSSIVLRREYNELRIVCSNVETILHLASEHRRRKERVQDSYR